MFKRIQTKPKPNKAEEERKLILETLAELLPTNNPKKAVILEKLKEV